MSFTEVFGNMRPIPKKIRDKLAQDSFMKKCCFQGCGKLDVEWNHALKYSGRQINEWYAIVPLCVEHHRGNNGTIYKEVKEWCSWVAIMRGIKDLQKKYPKYNWLQEKNYLTNKFTKWYEGK